MNQPTFTPSFLLERANGAFLAGFDGLGGAILDLYWAHVGGIPKSMKSASGEVAVWVEPIQVHPNPTQKKRTQRKDSHNPWGADA